MPFGDGPQFRDYLIFGRCLGLGGRDVGDGHRFDSPDPLLGAGQCDAQVSHRRLPVIGLSAYQFGRIARLPNLVLQAVQLVAQDAQHITPIEQRRQCRDRHVPFAVLVAPAP